MGSLNPYNIKVGDRVIIVGPLDQMNVIGRVAVVEEFIPFKEDLWAKIRLDDPVYIPVRPDPESPKGWFTVIYGSIRNLRPFKDPGEWRTSETDRPKEVEH